MPVLNRSSILKLESQDVAEDMEVDALAGIIGISIGSLIQQGLDLRVPAQPDLSIQQDNSMSGNVLGPEFGPLHEISKGNADFIFLSPTSCPNNCI